MSTLRRYLVAAILAILSAPKYALEAGRWVLKSVFAPPTPVGLEVETATDAVREWGRLARAYATSRLSSEPEPDLRALDEGAESWLRGLTDAECQRLLDFRPQRVSDHMLGAHLIPGLSRCQEYPRWAPAVVLADAPGDERYDAVKADLARDPASVPGYRVAA